MSKADPLFATVRAAAPAYTDGKRSEITQDTAGQLRVTSTPASSVKPTYRVDFGGLVGVSGNIVELIGSATKTIRVNYVFVPKPTVQVTLVGRKQSTASTGGTSTTPTPVPLDSGNAPATAVVSLYTVAPTLGTLVGVVFSMVLGTNDAFREQFGQGAVQQVVLRGVAESFALNIDAGATVRGYLEFTEE